MQALWWLFLFTGFSLARRDARIVCGRHEICSSKTRGDFMRLREKVKWLEELNELEAYQRTTYADISNPVTLNLLKTRLELCSNSAIPIGYMFQPDELLRNFSVVCAHEGGESYQTCTLGPLAKGRNYDFVPEGQWRALVQDARRRIGCVLNPISGKSIGEFHLCRDHCARAGISHFMALCLMVILLTTCVTGCARCAENAA
ncbi:unnamed protein product, partial [Mesorhabditis spiculigera]